jgi:protein phosphatase
MKYAIIGDVHGCHDKLMELVHHPSITDDCRVVWVGDLCDKGPDSAKVLDYVMWATRNSDYAVLGNHDDKLRRYLNGANVKMTAELQRTVDDIHTHAPGSTFVDELRGWLNSLPYYLMLDEGRLYVSHAGCDEKNQGLDTAKARSLNLYGKTNGQTGPDGYPVRLNWAKDYRGARTVVHGHVVVDEPLIQNGVYNVDTGCYKTGKLTALLYPSMELVST